VNGNEAINSDIHTPMRRLSEFQKKSITTSDGLSIYYEVSGKGKRTLIFLHGLGGDVAAWDEIRTFFHQLGYATIAIDLRGHGYSGHPEFQEGYHFERIADDVHQVLTAEKIRENIIVGHCFGGIVGYIYAARYPDSSAALILISISYKTPYISRNSLPGKLLGISMKKFAAIAPGKVSPRHADYTIGKFEKDFEPMGLLRVLKHNSLRNYFMLMDEMVMLDAEAEVRSLSLPTLMINGTDDSIYTAKMAKKIQSMIKDSELIFIDNGNHPVVLNNPMESARAIAVFLKKKKLQ
jgi:non-heme chloroperoxidase